MYSGRFSADQKPTIPLFAIFEFNVHISLSLRCLLLASGCLLSLNTSLWAQSNFIPLEKGDYKELEERPTYAQFLKSVAPTDSALVDVTQSRKLHRGFRMRAHSPLNRI